MLDILPDDVLLLILSYLDSATQIRSLALTSKRFSQLLQCEDGWRVFVRSRFPSVSLNTIGQYGYSEIAESLTWQSQCWDKRSLAFKAMLPISRKPARPRRHIIPYHSVVDAHLNVDTREEMVIWGAGENIVARRRRTKARSTNPEVRWHRYDGSQADYIPGYDDIKALSIVENASGQPGKLAFLVGRDNGHLSLQCAACESFGQHLADFSPSHATNHISGALPGPVPSQGTIMSVDVLRSRNLVAAVTKMCIFLYALPQEVGVDVAPSTHLDLATQISEQTGFILGNARWMSNEVMAIGLQGCKDPLRYVTLTPTGFETAVASKNAGLEERFDISYSKVCTGSLTPIDSSSITGSGSNLLLSAWRDGTVRLQDIRTSSPFDLVYCDNIDPWSEFEALLAFGTDRFVGGGVHGATVKVFDFRWPKKYYQTSTLPCGSDKPFPAPQQPFATSPEDPVPPRSCCNHFSGLRCRWHALSRDIYYRPNGSFFFSKSLPREAAYAGVWSMAKASNMSPNFYIGISGGLVEAQLRCTDTETDIVDPNFGYDALDKRASLGAGYQILHLDASLMETGDGVASAHNQRNIRVPPMRGKGWGRLDSGFCDSIPADFRRRHRLDYKYQILSDFKEFSGEAWWKDIDKGKWSNSRAAMHDGL